MTYYPDIPSASNKVQGDLDKMRANFQHLDPVAEFIAPYAAMIADSRIVDHNLDVTDPPNGWYVRSDLGLQMCYKRLHVVDGSDQFNPADIRTDWNLPASFHQWCVPGVVHDRESGVSRSEITGVRTNVVLNPPITSATVRALSVNGAFATGDTVTVSLFAFGV